MKLAIISDIHDNLVNLEKCLTWCHAQQIEKIICCGDVTDLDTIKFLSANFSGEIYLISGNMEIFEPKEISGFKNINYLGRFGRVLIDNFNVGIAHEPWFITKVKELGDCSIIFYGHTHEPWIKKDNNIIEVNPGTLGGVFQRATFAVWDTKTKGIELKLLEEIKV